MVVKEVGGEPYTQELFNSKVAGDDDFDVLFAHEGFASSTEDQAEQRRSIQTISRSAFYGNDTCWSVASAWQLEPWCPDSRILEYLALFGMQAENLQEWQQCPSDS